MRLFRLLGGVLLALWLSAPSAPVIAYDLITHAKISDRVFDASGTAASGP